MQKSAYIRFLFLIGTVLIALFISSPVAFAQEDINSNQMPTPKHLPDQNVSADPIESFQAQTGSRTSQIIPVPAVGNLSNPFAQLNKQAGVQTKSSSTESISIRGSVAMDRVLFLVDDFSINLDAIGPASILIPYELESPMQIFKGPSSTYFGAGAMGGAISLPISTKQKNTASIGLASYEHYNFSVQQSFREQKSLISVFSDSNSGKYSYKAGPNYQSGKRKNNESDLLRVINKNIFKTEDWNFENLIIAASKDYKSPGSLSYPETTDSFASAGLLGLKAQRFYKNSDYEFSAYGIMNETSFESTNYESEFSQKSFGSKALSKTQISDNYISQFSIDWRRLHYDYKSTKEESFYKDHIDLSHLSLFYWDDYSFEPSFRYLTQDQKTIFAALAQKKWNHSLAYLHYTQAYKIPNFSDLYDEASYYQPNPDLKPEHSDQWELGHIWQNSNLEIKNSLYYIEYKDLIQRKSLGTNLSTKENIAQAKAHGWEFSARKSFMFWAVEYSHNIMNAYDQTQALAMSPHQQHSFSLSHYWAFLEFVVAANYISAAKDLNFTTGKLQDLPEFLAYDFSIKTYKTNGFDLSLGVENFNNAARVYSLDYPEYQRNYFIKYSQYF